MVHRRDHILVRHSCQLPWNTAWQARSETPQTLPLTPPYLPSKRWQDSCCTVNLDLSCHTSCSTPRMATASSMLLPDVIEIKFIPVRLSPIQLSHQTRRKTGLN
eukprot:2961197-Amphidinium_carterae.1